MDLINIIKEEVCKILLKEEYQNNDIVDFNKINLQNEYNKLNSLLFKNELPNIPLKFMNRKRALGHVKSTITFHRSSPYLTHLSYAEKQNVGKATINELGISLFYKMTYKIFKDTLAHEMIHVKLLLNGKHNYQNAHDINFTDEAERINNMGLDFNIEIVSEKDHSISIEKLKNPLIAIVVEIDNEPYRLSVTTPNVFQKDIKSIESLFNNLIKYGRFSDVKIVAFETKNPQFSKYQIHRNYGRRFGSVKLNNEIFDELQLDSIIYNKEINKNNINLEIDENMINKTIIVI